MIWNTLQCWKGAIEIDGKHFNSVSAAQKALDSARFSCSSILLLTANKKAVERKAERSESSLSDVYRVTVRQYMTRKATVDFDFMKKWNNDVPMPLRTMVGTVEKETRGMVYMKLHGDITNKVTQYCMRCGRPITNPVSQFFGLGPECGGHNYVNPFENDDDLQRAVSDYRKNYLQNIKWEGWIIKSAIIEQEVVSNEC